MLKKLLIPTLVLSFASVLAAGCHDSSGINCGPGVAGADGSADGAAGSAGSTGDAAPDAEDAATDAGTDALLPDASLDVTLG
jgi:hypothetical protein